MNALGEQFCSTLSLALPACLAVYPPPSFHLSLTAAISAQLFGWVNHKLLLPTAA